MPTFAYRAKKGPTDIVEGTIEAATTDEAVDKLDALGLLPVQLSELKNPSPKKEAPQSNASSKSQKKASAETTANPQSFKKISFTGRAKSSDITIFSRQLASLIKAGVPILKAIWIIQDQSSNPRMKEILFYVYDEVKNGKTLSSALADFPKVFPPIYIALVRTGENTGTLHESLMQIADYRQKQEEIYSNIRAAMAYPVLMFLTGVGTIVFMLTFVIPKLTTLFKSMGGNLPAPTRILMKISSLFQNHFFWMAVGVLFMALIIIFKTNAKHLEALWSRVSLKLPLIKNFVIKSELARFSRTMEILIKSGIPILKSIEVTAPVLSNSVLRAQLLKTGQEVSGGGSFGDSLRESGYFPPFMTNLLSVGEQSGKIEESLAETAQFYERETAQVIKMMTSLLEPMMILVMGIIVGFIVIAMMLPMFELNLMVK